MKRPVALVVNGGFAGNTGYNVHTRFLCEQLEKKYLLFEIDSQDTHRTNQKKIAQIDGFFQQNPGYLRVNLHMLHPQLSVEQLKWPGLHIYMVIWESTVIPDEWLILLQDVDQIWVPTHWSKQVLINEGIATEKIFVVPEGTDHRIFNPAVPPVRALSNYQGYKFIHVGKYEERKGTEKLIRAFDECFNEEDVYLVLLSNNIFLPDFDINETVDRLGLKHRERILCISPLEHLKQIASLYTACDAAVFPTSAEAWGLPILDAMACGLATIVTNYSGPTEYISPETNLLLDYKLVPLSIQMIDNPSRGQGMWAEPDILQLKKSMRFCYENREHAKNIGELATNSVTHQWLWSHAARKAEAALEQLSHTQEPFSKSA